MTLALISVYNTKPPEKEMYERQLFGLLAEREPYQNISHKKMPTYEQHESFVQNKPYKGWYVIYKEGDFVGSIYLSKENNIGLFIRKCHVGEGYGKLALKELINQHPQEEYFANIAPFNSNSIAFFMNFGFKYYGMQHDEYGNLVQYEFKYTNPLIDLSKAETLIETNQTAPQT